MFFEPPNLTERYKKMIEDGAKKVISNHEFLRLEIEKWKNSQKRREQITGERYYNGFHDILGRKRTAIGTGGNLIEVDNLPNNRIVDNQYRKVVDQKTNFLVGQPVVFSSENKNYVEEVKEIFNEDFLRVLKALCVDCLNGGISWLHPYYDEDGEFKFKRFAPHEILPFWKDSEHIKLDFAVRVYEVKTYEGRQEKTIEKVEVYSENGVERLVFYQGKLIEDIENPSSDYINIDGRGFNWAKIPLIPFKYNYGEAPLIRDLKAMQDAINLALSDFQNVMQEDARNTILIVKNYDGEDLGDFRKNLSTFASVKIRDGGGVDKLNIDINVEAFKSFIELQKKEMIEVAKAYSAADLRGGNAPNEMNIKSVFNDINMDANAMELEFTASFKALLWFINVHLANAGKGNFDKEKINVIFNKDTIVNESQIIADLKNSVGLLSDETLIANHPWIEDVEAELAKIKKQREEEAQEMDYIIAPTQETEEK